MVDLTILVSTVSLQVNDEAAAQIVLNFAHGASHYALRALENLFGESRDLLWVLESASRGGLQGLVGFLLVQLSTELDSEHVVAYRLKQLSKASHIQTDLLIVVVGTNHGFKDGLGGLKGVTHLVLDGDQIPNIEHREVARHG